MKTCSSFVKKGSKNILKVQNLISLSLSLSVTHTHTHTQTHIHTCTHMHTHTYIYIGKQKGAPKNKKKMWLMWGVFLAIVVVNL